MLSNAKRPMIIIGSSVLQQEYGPLLYSTVVELSNTLSCEQNWNVLNVLHRQASQVGALDIGYTPGIGDISNTKLLYLLGAVRSLCLMKLYILLLVIIVTGFRAY